MVFCEILRLLELYLGLQVLFFNTFLFQLKFYAQKTTEGMHKRALMTVYIYLNIPWRRNQAFS